MSNQQKIDQTVADTQKIASNAATEAQQQGQSLYEQGTKLAADTLAYAQQQAQGIVGAAKQQGADTSKAADDASKDASKITDSAAKEGQAQAEQVQHTLADLTEQARAFIGHGLQSANEYIKPQETGEQAQGLVNQLRNTASSVVDQGAAIIAGAQKDASKAAQDASGQASNLAADTQKTASDAAAQAQGTVQGATK